RCAGETGRCARRQGSRRRGERYGERLFSEGRLLCHEPQHRASRRRMARQSHDDQAACSEGKRAMKRPDTPFPRHWLYYLILKYAVIAAAVAMSFYTVYRLYRGEQYGTPKID